MSSRALSILNSSITPLNVISVNSVSGYSKQYEQESFNSMVISAHIVQREWPHFSILGPSITSRQRMQVNSGHNSSIVTCPDLNSFVISPIAMFGICPRPPTSTFHVGHLSSFPIPGKHLRQTVWPQNIRCGSSSGERHFPHKIDFKSSGEIIRKVMMMLGLDYCKNWWYVRDKIRNDIQIEKKDKSKR